MPAAVSFAKVETAVTQLPDSAPYCFRQWGVADVSSHQLKFSGSSGAAGETVTFSMPSPLSVHRVTFTVEAAVKQASMSPRSSGSAVLMYFLSGRMIT